MRAAAEKGKAKPRLISDRGESAPGEHKSGASMPTGPDSSAFYLHRTFVCQSIP